MSDPAALLGITESSFLGLYLEEDYALKEKISGLQISDVGKPARNVPVWFTLPQEELRTRTFPHGTITPLSETVASDREHRGRIKLSYVPYTDVGYQCATPQATPQLPFNFIKPPSQLSAVLPPGAESAFNVPVTNTAPTVDFPIPIDLMYQVSFYTRSNQQIKQIKNYLNAPDRLHPRFGYLNCSGGTARRIVVQDKRDDSRYDADAPNKRLFSVNYTLLISSEIQEQAALGTRVERIVLALKPS